MDGGQFITDTFITYLSGTTNRNDTSLLLQKGYDTTGGQDLHTKFL